MVAPGQIVVINGTSSSGKTSTAKAFQELRAQAGECWVVLGQDDFLPKLPKRWIEVGKWTGSFAADGVRFDPDGDCPSWHIGEQGRRLLLGYRCSVGATARAGVNLVVDEVSIEAREWQEWNAALDGLVVVWVALRCDVDVAAEREAARGDRMVGIARGQVDLVHRYPKYDLELDSTVATTDELARQLHEFVK